MFLCSTFSHGGHKVALMDNGNIIDLSLLNWSRYGIIARAIVVNYILIIINL